MIYTKTDCRSGMSIENRKELVQAARDRLDDWLYDARRKAYNEMFAGEDAVLTEGEIRKLDWIDSEMHRESGEGLWGEAEYGIVQGEKVSEDGSPRVVCTYHPQIPESAYRGEGIPDRETREKLNDALWEYYDRVAEYLRIDLEDFLNRKGGAAED